MTRLTVPALVGILVLSSLPIGGEEAPPPAATAEAGAALKSAAAAAVERLAADDIAQVHFLRTGVFLDRADGQQKAVQFIQSGRAHQDAFVSLKQCQSCHDQPAANAQVANPHALGVTLVSRSGPWVGVSVGPADDVLRAQLKLPEGTGVVVTKVVADGPAGQSGVAEHDILLSVDGRPVPTGDALDEIVKAWKQDGAPLTMRLLREGQTLEKQVTPALAGARDESHGLTLALDGQPKYRIGVNVAEPDETLRTQLRLGETGVVVMAVAENSPAAKQGLKANDVLVSANGKPLKNPQELTETVRHAAESPVALGLLRGGVSLRITVTPEKDPTPTNLAVELEALYGQQRELMLVQPGFVYDFAAGAPATQPSTPAAPAGERLDKLSSQLEELRNTVNALRDELKESRTRPAENR